MKTPSNSIARTSVIFIAVVSFTARYAASDEPVNTYPNPGYTLLGCYRDEDPTYFDYSVGSTLNWSGDTFPNKKQWWQEYKDGYARNPNAKYRIISAYFGVGHATQREPGLTVEKVRGRLDAFLAPEPGIPTYPQLLHGFCISEENTTYKNADLLDAAARHGIDKYGIPVWQWLSPPAPPAPTLAASGWVFDNYGVSYKWFRKHVMKYVSMDKPLHSMVWASDPSWYKKYESGQALIEDTNEELRVLKEFNIPASVFAVAQPGGSVGMWKSKNNPDMAAIRQWVKNVRKEMHTVKPGRRIPAESANRSQGQPVEAGRPNPIPTVYEEDFSGFRWIEDASLKGFLDLKLTSEPEARPGLLLVKTRADRAVDAALIYEFKSNHPLTEIRVQLDAAAPSVSESRNEIALSVDMKTWPLTASQAGNDRINSVTLDGDAQFLDGSDTVYLRVRMRNDAGAAGVPANRLDHLKVQCSNAGVALWWNDWGSSELQGPWAKFFRKIPDRDIDGDGKGGYIKLDSTGMTVWGTKKIQAPEGHRIDDIVIDWGVVEAYKKRGGCWIIQASPTGAFAGEEAEARHEMGWGRLLLDLRGKAAFEGIATLHVRLMGSNSYNYQSSYAGPITVIGSVIPERR